MVTCAQCGRESPDGFGFCPGCGAPLVAAPVREVRKVVTVLFCDLTGSTAIGERTDPEALRALMNRYYETARTVLERHGGTVEKFVGDAVMAVFGIPVASEDDALRAVRAAVELRDVVHELALEARIGVNTGPVVAGEGDTLVTGDAVNVAARLEQAGGAGEILLGDDTWRLVRDAAEVEPLELELKGKSGRVAAHRLHALDASAVGVARHLERPIVGRARERERLHGDFADVVASSSCRLFTLIGPAGIGKSRLVAHFLERIDDGAAAVARGRALSYGEGITYWPLVEMLIQLGIEPHEAIRSTPAETQLATRALLEAKAADRPLVLVVDDLHWAEAPMLDLVEHVVDWSRDAPIMVLCVARPELLDARPGWAGGKLNATSILLEPLGEAEAVALADGLLAGVELDDETRARMLGAAEGNPLFLEEMAALAREARGTVDVPPTIQALLQARLDTLSADERAVVDRGSVEGKVFHRGAVTALAPEPQRGDVPGRLLSLVRKELVRPDVTQIPGDDAFRFRHLLIRDTAYEGLPKATRADLHERFATWLDGNATMVEQDEIVGYHLEQAARYRTELDASNPVELASRAAERLGKAGHAAVERGDIHAARNLLHRAMSLVGEGSIRRRLIPDLADALIENRERFDEVNALLDELSEGTRHDRALATVLRIRNNPNGPLDQLLGRLDQAEETLAAAGDTIGLARSASARGWVYWGACRMGDSHEAHRRAYELLRSTSNGMLRRDAISGMCNSSVFSGIPADEMRDRLDTLARDADAAGPLLGATVRSFRVRLDYVTGKGDLESVRSTATEEVTLLEQTGSASAAATVRLFEVMMVPWLDSDFAAVEEGARYRVARTKTHGARAFHANALADWARALCMLGRFERALTVVAEARGLADSDDIADQMALDMTEAHARALAGEADVAYSLVERAKRIGEGTDIWVPVFDHQFTEACVLQAVGDREGARHLLEELVERQSRRGFHRVADRYRRDLAQLTPPSSYAGG